ncbi:MAG: carbohydrate ABC transporter permease [Thermomicrobiales bacterium]|nr:carbohydrate ABC transporter permease [Thermomicrobiales bacterium]
MRWSVIVLFGVFTVVSLYPMIWLLTNSFKTDFDLFEASWALPEVWHWENYRRAWDFGIARYLINSVLVTTVSVSLTVTVSLMAAYALSRFRFRGQTAFLFFILGGLMLAPEVSLLPLFRILQQLGIYNTYLAMILPYVAFGIPFVTFLMRSYIMGLPRELEEAAYIDGAGPLGVLRNVIVPLSRPIIASAALIEAMRVWNEFMFALTFISSEDLKTLPIGIMSFVSALQTEWTVVMAALVLSALPMIVLFLATQRQYIEGLTAGAIKG